MVFIIKNTKTFLIIATLLLLLGGVFSLQTQSVSAQRCYLTTAAGGGYTQVDCPASLNAVAPNCYLAGASVGGVGPFSQTECSRMTGGDNDQQYEASYVESDCQGSSIRAGAEQGSDQHCGILNYLVIFINILSGLVGIVVVGSVIYGGIQYSMSAGDPQKVSAAKSRIRNAIIALLFFVFMYGFLNFLVPGGLI